MILELGFFTLLLVVGFFLIIKSADFFVDQSAALGRHYGLSKLIIGLTIVAIGTSLPELFTSVISFLFTDNYSDFIVGTVVGSNISNTLLVFGLFLIFAKDFVVPRREIVNVVVNILSTAAIITFVLLGFVNFMALFLLLGYFAYVIYTSKYDKDKVLHEEESIEEKIKSIPRSYFILFLTVIGLFVGSRFVITSIENIGSLLAIPTAYLTLTTIAIGTSLPEVAVTINTARKKEFLMGIGNVLGSNTMNIAVIFSLSGLFGYYTIDTSLYIYSVIFLALATAIFSVSLLLKKFKSRQGWLLLTLYLAYIITFFLG